MEKLYNKIKNNFYQLYTKKICKIIGYNKESKLFIINYKNGWKIIDKSDIIYNTDEGYWYVFNIKDPTEIKQITYRIYI